MTLRDGLSILQKALYKATEMGFLQEENSTISGIDFVLEPPSLIAHRTSSTFRNSTDCFFDLYFPLLETGWAIIYFGRELTGDTFFGMLPAWRYHQHKLLEFIQNGEMDEYYRYIELFL